LAEIHASSGDKAAEAAEMLLDCYRIAPEKPVLPPFIRGVVK
jgi:hypothetical protein